MGKIFLTYILFINLVTFVQFGIDKRKAIKNKRRIKEKTLFLTALPFGGIGAYLGMQVFNHKKNYWNFSVGLTIIGVIQTVAIYFIIVNM